jgi:hypothetical protein
MAMGQPMKRSYGFFILLGLLGISLCWIVYRSARPPAEAPAVEGARAAASTATPEPADLAELQQQVARLKSQMWSQEQRLAAADPAKAAVKDPAAKDPRTDPEARAAEERKHKELVAGIDAEFHNEPTSSKWASAMSSTIQTAVADDNDLRPLVRGFECRSQTCRVEIADDGSGKLNKSLPMFVDQVGRDLSKVVFDRIGAGDGAVTRVLYLSRRTEAATGS